MGSRLFRGVSFSFFRRGICNNDIHKQEEKKKKGQDGLMVVVGCGWLVGWLGKVIDTVEDLIAFSFFFLVAFFLGGLAVVLYMYTVACRWVRTASENTRHGKLLQRKHSDLK